MRSTWPGVLLPAVLVASLATTVAADPATRPATRAIERTELPAFGVAIPPPPPGFEQVPVLRHLMVAGIVAEWRRVEPGAPAGTAEQARKTREQIHLMWRPLAFSTRRGVRDHFRETARNPGAGGGDNAFFRTAREVEVPHPCDWPTVRFERPDGTADPDDSLVRTESVAANNVAYVLMHGAPRGATDAGKAAFGHLAAGLRYAPPAPMGRCLRPADPRRGVPDIPAATIRLLEPFRGSGDVPIAWAWDLTAFTTRFDPPADNEDVSAPMYFAEGGRDGPGEWIEEQLDGTPSGWLRDDADLRLAAPLPGRSHGRRAFVGGTRIGTTGRWLWVAMLLPPRVVADAGGDADAAAALEAMLRTVEPLAPAAPG